MQHSNHISTTKTNKTHRFREGRVVWVWPLLWFIAPLLSLPSSVFLPPDPVSRPPPPPALFCLIIQSSFILPADGSVQRGLRAPLAVALISTHRRQKGGQTSRAHSNELLDFIPSLSLLEKNEAQTEVFPAENYIKLALTQIDTNYC